MSFGMIPLSPDDKPDGFVLLSMYEKLESENAKLRELVKHLYEYRQAYFKTGIYPTDHGVTEQRMRELGVEVG